MKSCAASAAEAALDNTLQTAGRSITFSGLTLMLTMAVLTLFPVMIIRSIALSIAIVAGVAVLAGLLLLPSLLVVSAPYLNSLNLRRLCAVAQALARQARGRAGRARSCAGPGRASSSR